MSVTQNEIPGRYQRTSFWQTLGVFDWLWALAMLGGGAYIFARYGSDMDGYEIAIMAGTTLSLIAVGWTWKPVRMLSIGVIAITLFALSRYGGSLAIGESDFFLRYLLSSQSAIMWMSALFVMAMATYFIAMIARSEFTGKVASSLTWSAAAMGLVGLLVRWRETYLVNPDFGHIPVSNLYEVFVLFAIITALIYLFYEGRYRTRALGGFVLLVISAAVAFLLWYSFSRNAHEIQPLVPALQSYWMKIHVPANFVGYGAFALAAMIGVAWLLAERFPAFASRMPEREVMDDVMYKSIALGFAFFTVATILGALWAAEAWGGYWSWDPKETWALIVWLNYAAWLHMRLTKGWRGAPMAWWSVAGLFVTLFAFLGVNMFLSGLHSYGEL
ncbi:MAG TPA: c-type cytochrome biogenesis protein CcsB [Gammaproteobacteria bacterium]|jgi:cytochrome c-type biogenesis protein CcsB|nr:c-type cytochrome biogenesis protein CcsB [Gammaproteobacteria bacterium]